MRFRVLYDFIPLKGEMIQGSHGRGNVPFNEMPIIISENNHIDNIEAIAVKDVILYSVF